MILHCQTIYTLYLSLVFLCDSVISVVIIFFVGKIYFGQE